MAITKTPQLLRWLAMLILCGAAVAAPHDRRTSLDDAVWEAREHQKGRVISAKTRRRDGREIHNIRILTPEGRVKRYRVDAESGRRLRGRGRR